MSTIKLTQAAIKRAAYAGDGKSRDVRWDESMPGFGLRIYPSGRRAFVLSYRNEGGQKRMMVLGDFGPLTLDQARIRARKHLVTVEDGGDPLEEKQKIARGETFGDLTRDYLERHAKPRKRSWKDDERRLNSHIPNTWGGRRVAAIRRADVASLHAKLGATHPYEANRVLSLLHVIFRLARQWGYLEPTAENPASDIDRFREQKRKRWLTEDELPRLGAQIDREPNVYIRGAFWLYLLSGLRKSELLQARRSDVDWNRGTLRLPDTKSGDEQTVALSAPAMAIMQSLPELEDNPFLFPGAKEGQHLVNIDKSWRRIRADAGLSDVRLHDLRRTAGSWMSQSGVDLNTIRDALRHADLSTTLIYARLGEDPAREAMEAHGQRIMEVAGKRLAVAKGATKE